MTESRADHNRQIELARSAARGDDAARRQLNAMIDDLIRQRTDVFCKRFCRENRFRFRCTLPSPWGGAPSDAVLCEWGNGSYAWMLEDLTGEPRLQAFDARNGATVRDYLASVAHSLPFYERWKNWRFGRRVHVPAYIAELAPHANRVFLALRAGDRTGIIAQQLGMAEQSVDELAQRIVVELTRRGRLHLLDPPTTVSMTAATPDGNDLEVASHDPPPEKLELADSLRRAWSQLDELEQFVLEAMVIEERDAQAVLHALKTRNVALSDKVPAHETNRQQLYYFRRKCVAKLGRLLESHPSQIETNTVSAVLSGDVDDE